MQKLTRLAVYAAALVVSAAGFGCDSSNDELPDCKGGVDAYSSLCPSTTTEDSADKQLKMSGCKNYEMFDSPEKVTEYKNRSNRWISCVKSATTCSAAKACQFSE